MVKQHKIKGYEKNTIHVVFTRLGNRFVSFEDKAVFSDLEKAKQYASELEAEVDFNEDFPLVVGIETISLQRFLDSQLELEHIEID